MGGQNSKGSISGNSGINNTVNFIHSSGEIESSSTIIKKQELKESDVWQTFTWSYGGSQVLLTGSFYKWKQTTALEKNGEEFSITIQLPRGLHQYKFIVDGEWRFSPQDPIIPDANGNINNFIDTTNFQKIMDRKDESVGKSKPSKEQQNDKENTTFQGAQEFVKYAPKLPPHYEACSFLRSEKYNSNLSFPNGGHEGNRMEDENQKFQESLTEAEIQELFNSPHCLPPPYHVEVDHLIRQLNKNYSSYCITQRFKNKYTTYKYFMTSQDQP